MSDITVTTSDQQIKGKKWFGLGKPIQAKTLKEILAEGGIDWTVSKRPMVTTMSPPTFREDDKAKRFPIPMDSMGVKRIHNLLSAAVGLLVKPNHEPSQELLQSAVNDFETLPFIPMVRDYAVVRDDLNLPLGVLGAGYSPVNNEESLSMLSKLLDEERVEVERVGTFNGGANVWVIARLPNSITIGPDVMDQYLKISWSHDGSEKLSATFIAHMRKSDVQLNPKVDNARVSIEIRHTKNAKKRIEIAEKILDEGDLYFSGVETKLNELMSTPMTTDQMDKYLQTILPDPAPKWETDKDGKRVNKASSRNSNSRGRVMEIFANQNSRISHTKYAGLMSVASWCDREKTVRVTSKDKKINGENNEEQMRNENRLQGIWQKSGSARKMKEQAFAEIFGE